jgi:glutamate dehydrogenase (NAD(P)+)
MACALGDCQDYIFGPDMGTDEQCMAWVKSEIGRAVGLPRDVGGIPLDEVGATGWGLRHACEVAAKHAGFPLAGARIVVQGFGAVGIHAARFLAEQGAVLVAVSDSRGAVVAPEGLAVEALVEHKRQGKAVAEFPDGDSADRDAVLDAECEIWIPAARPDVIREDNVARLRARLIVAGANIPVTPGAEAALYERGILNVPDFIANAGGVICAAMEYHGATQGQAFDAIEERIRANTEAVLTDAHERGVPPRQAAVDLAVARVKRAMSYRRWSVF